MGKWTLIMPHTIIDYLFFIDSLSLLASNHPITTTPILSSEMHFFFLLGCLSNVRVSMLEIYNDECRDLLHPEIPSRDIALREDKEGRMFFTGAREEIVADKKVGSRQYPVRCWYGTGL